MAVPTSRITFDIPEDFALQDWDKSIFTHRIRNAFNHSFDFYAVKKARAQLYGVPLRIGHEGYVEPPAVEDELQCLQYVQFESMDQAILTALPAKVSEYLGIPVRYADAEAAAAGSTPEPGHHASSPSSWPWRVGIACLAVLLVVVGVAAAAHHRKQAQPVTSGGLVGYPTAHVQTLAPYPQQIPVMPPAINAAEPEEGSLVDATYTTDTPRAVLNSIAKSMPNGHATYVVRVTLDPSPTRLGPALQARRNP